MGDGEIYCCVNKIRNINTHVLLTGSSTITTTTTTTTTFIHSFINI